MNCATDSWEQATQTNLMRQHTYTHQHKYKKVMCVTCFCLSLSPPYVWVCVCVVARVRLCQSNNSCGAAMRSYLRRQINVRRLEKWKCWCQLSWLHAIADSQQKLVLCKAYIVKEYSSFYQLQIYYSHDFFVSVMCVWKYM